MVLLDGVAGQRSPLLDDDNFLDVEKMEHDSEPTPANAPAKAGAGPDAPEHRPHRPRAIRPEEAAMATCWAHERKYAHAP